MNLYKLSCQSNHKKDTPIQYYLLSPLKKFWSGLFSSTCKLQLCKASLVDSSIKNELRLWDIWTDRLISTYTPNSWAGVIKRTYKTLSYHGESFYIHFSRVRFSCYQHQAALKVLKMAIRVLFLLSISGFRYCQLYNIFDCLKMKWWYVNYVMLCQFYHWKNSNSLKSNYTTPKSFTLLK